MKHNNYYKLIINTLLFGLGNVGSKVLVFILMPIYTTKLTTAEYGISELVLTGANLLVPIVSVSIQDATLRFSLDKKNNSGEVLKNTLAVLIIGTIITLLLTPIVNCYKAINEWTTYFTIITIAYMIRNALSIYLKSIDKTFYYSLDSILYTLYLMITNIVFLVFLKIGLKGYFLAIIISTFLSIIELVFLGKIFSQCKNNKVNNILLKKMIIFSLPMVLNNISWWIINSSDKIMIQVFDSVSSSGIYSVASKIPSILITLTNIFNQAWIISSVSEYDTSKDSTFFTSIFKVFSCILIIFSSFIIIIIKPFMSIYVGKDFVGCWEYVPLLLLGSIFQAYATFFGAIYTSAKKNVNVMITTLLAAFINVILNLLLIPKISIHGAIIATAISYLIVFVYRMLDCQKYVKFEINYIIFSISILVLIIQSILVINIQKNIIYCISILFFMLEIILNYKIIESIVIKILEKICLRNKKI